MGDEAQEVSLSDTTERGAMILRLVDFEQLRPFAAAWRLHLESPSGEKRYRLETTSIAVDSQMRILHGLRLAGASRLPVLVRLRRRDDWDMAIVDDRTGRLMYYVRFTGAGVQFHWAPD